MSPKNRRCQQEKGKDVGKSGSFRIGHFITQVYHQKRPHSALGDLTPLEFQREIFS